MLGRAGGGLLSGVQCLPLRQQLLLIFLVSVIGDAAVYRTDLFAFGSLVGAHTLGASLNVDYIDLIAFGDSLVGALGLACPATDALVCDFVGQFSSS